MPMSGKVAISATDIWVRPCKGMRLGDDAEQTPARQRLEIDRRMLEAVADRHHLAASEQQIVDRILDLQDVEVDLEVDIFVLGRPRRRAAP